ncbi:MAG: SCP2 sterol-binding domain-containing protein [Solirubrobacteraceae bacterium]
MPLFKDADELYSHLGRLFEEALADDEVGPRLRELDCIVQFRLRRPDALVTVKAVQEEEPEVDLGITKLKPQVTLLAEADTMHRLWLGQVNPAVALGSGKIRATGPVGKILSLVPLITVVLERYRVQLTEAGREDLAAV